MTIPLWCLTIAAFLPYLFPPFSFGERKANDGELNVAYPRQQAAGLKGLGARAMGAHHNAFEALGVFSVAVLASHLAGAHPGYSAGLAIAWVVFRVLHGVFYLRDVPSLRSASFAGAFFCAIGLLVMAGTA